MDMQVQELEAYVPTPPTFRSRERTRTYTIAELRKLGWTVFCYEEEDDVQ